MRIRIANLVYTPQQIANAAIQEVSVLVVSRGLIQPFSLKVQPCCEEKGRRKLL